MPTKESILKIVGVTGNIASGKTSFCQIMSNVGPCRIIDADFEAHRLYELKPHILEEIAATFGSQYVSEGKLDRKALGKKVFADKSELEKLNALVHPYLMTHLESLLAEENNDVEFVLLDAALLFELGYDKIVHYVVTIDAREELRAQRLIEKGLSEQEAFDRIRSQMPSTEKVERSDWVVVNENGNEHLLREAERIWEALSSC